MINDKTVIMKITEYVRFIWTSHFKPTFRPKLYQIGSLCANTGKKSIYSDTLQCLYKLDDRVEDNI